MLDAVVLEKLLSVHVAVHERLQCGALLLMPAVQKGACSRGWQLL